MSRNTAARFARSIFLALAMVVAGIAGPEGSGDASGGGGIPMGGYAQGKPLSLKGTVSTLSLVSLGPSEDPAGAAARFDHPSGVATDGKSVYFSEAFNHTIRKVDIATGTLTLLAGRAGEKGSVDGPGAMARFNTPRGIATDGENLYVADSANSTIRKVAIATGAVTTLAGKAEEKGSGDGNGAAARFSNPYGVATDGANLYVAERGNCTIRKVVIATGAVTTLAGKAGEKGSADGTGPAARFYSPFHIAADGKNLYVADTFNHTVRKVVIATGAVTTLAGKAEEQGSADGNGAEARFAHPSGIAADGANLYVTDSWSHTIRKVVIATGDVTTVAGGGGRWGHGALDGKGTEARFNQPDGIATDGANLYVADEKNGIVRKVAISTGMVATLFRGEASPGVGKGVGTDAAFHTPVDLATDGANLYVTVGENHTIRKVGIATGAVTTLAGAAMTSGETDGIGSAARFYYPYGITTDGKFLYVADSSNHAVRKVEIATGAVTTLAGEGRYGGGYADGVGWKARFFLPAGVTTDGSNLYLTARYSNTIRKVVIATGEVTTLAGKDGTGGSRDGTGSEARFHQLWGITTDGRNLYLADGGNHTIRKVVIATGEVTTLAGKAGSRGSRDGTGAGARFNAPFGVTTDGTNLYVTDAGNHTIRKVVIATGEVKTVAGNPERDGFADGAGPTARFNGPAGITTDGKTLYVVDAGNRTIRKIE